MPPINTTSPWDAKLSYNAVDLSSHLTQISERLTATDTQHAVGGSGLNARYVVSCWRNLFFAMLRRPRRARVIWRVAGEQLGYGEMVLISAPTADWANELIRKPRNTSGNILNEDPTLYQCSEGVDG